MTPDEIQELLPEALRAVLRVGEVWQIAARKAA